MNPDDRDQLLIRFCHGLASDENRKDIGYLFSVQNRPGLPASGKEPEKSSHSTMDKRRPMIYLG
jgi:hypothetical protein